MNITASRLSLAFIFIASLNQGCAAKFLKTDNEERLSNIKEYEEKLEVKPLPLAPEVAAQIPPGNAASLAPTEIAKEDKAKKTSKKPEPPKPAPKPTPVTKKRQPELEDSAGFIGRRPIADPFWVGEKTTLVVSYFGVKGGDMTMQVRPFVEVNGKKSYHLAATLNSSSVFSAFYSVEDYGETFVDYNELIPFNFLVNVKESGQLREVRNFFDWTKNKSNFWEKKYTKKHGHQEKKLEWDIEPYTQNIFSAPFYLRVFDLEPGHSYKFRLADEARNFVVTAHVLNREKVTVDAGTFDTVKIRPEVAIDGIFQPMGDVFFWLTDDDRKFFVKIEAKIKIGTLKAEASEIVRGVKPQ
jgi:hypothetical protein